MLNELNKELELNGASVDKLADKEISIAILEQSKQVSGGGEHFMSGQGGGGNYWQNIVRL